MSQTLSQVTLIDLLDIGLVAVLFYAVILSMKRARVGRVLIGISVLTVVYLLARGLGLTFTAWIFQGFFATLLIVLVVVFQPELRRLFERVATWSFGSERAFTVAGSLAETTVAVATRLARRRIGALIVIPGKDSIHHHVNGGIPLEGRLSAPLLESLFDPGSPGHDGAVILEGERVSRFSAHLPLSNNAQRIGQRGTRHAAALGLSECTDALCVVVSEERGCVSMARDGVLHEFEHPVELNFELQQFLDEKWPRRPRSRLSLGTLRYNWMEKGLAVGIAAAAWLAFVAGSSMASHTYRVPVILDNVPSDVLVDQLDPEELEVTLTGPPRYFDLLEGRQLEVRIDAFLLRFGRRTFDVAGGNIRHPRELTVVEVRPQQVVVSVKVPHEENAASEKPKDKGNEPH